MIGCSKSRRGFTLIEVLLAVSLLTLITIAATSLFWSSIKTWRTVRYEARCMKTARIVFTQLEQDLRNVVDSIGKGTGGSIFLPFLYAADARDPTNGNKNELVFYVTRLDHQLMEVTYYTANARDPTDEQTQFSVVGVDLATGTASTERVIASRFHSISFRFIELQGGGLVSLDNWKDLATGAPKNYLPKAVEVTITFKERRGVGPKWTKTIAIPRELGV